MRALCQLCGTVIEAQLDLSQLLQIAKECETEDERTALRRVNEFDQLAARMNHHLSRHHKDQATMAILVSHAATKVYAATHMESITEPEFNRLRTSWRKSLLRDVGVYRDEDEPAAAAAEPLGAGDAT